MPQEKKQDIPINLPESYYHQLLEVCEVLGLKEGECAVHLCTSAAPLYRVAKSLAIYFKKAYFVDSGEVLFGDWKAPSYKEEFKTDTTYRVHVRVGSDDWETLSGYWNAMDCPKSHAVCLLVMRGIELAKENLK